jgi:histidyl-tRNA synthetase
VADAEVIEVTVRFFEGVGLASPTVLLNSIGREECRVRYREAILTHMAAFLAGRDETFRAQSEKNPLRLLDSKDPAVQDALQGLAPIHDFLEDDCRARLDQVVRRLGEASVTVQLRPDIVRGLDYYTETVFEIQHQGLGAQTSICGGGRYDNLISELGGASTPSVGVGIGVERTLLALEAEAAKVPEERLHAFLVATDASAFDAALALARDLRGQGLAIGMDIDGKSMKSQLRQADKSGAPYALVIGPDELAKGVVQVKALATGEQREVLAESVAMELRQ